MAEEETPKRIRKSPQERREEVLDAAVQAYAQTVRERCAEEVEKLAQLQKMWALRKPILDAHILSLREKAQKLEQEVDWIVMEKVLKQK